MREEGRAKPGEDTQARQNGAGKPSSPATSRERSELLDLRREALDIRAEAREMREEGKAFRSEAEQMRKAATERMEASRTFANAGATELKKFTAKAEKLTEDLEQTGREAAASARQAGREAVRAIRAEAERAGSGAAETIRQTAKEQAERVLGVMEERQGELIQTTSEAAEKMTSSANRSASQIEGERRQLRAAVNESEQSVRGSTRDLESAAADVRGVKWGKRLTTLAVAVLLPTLIVVGLTWMRPGWGLTDQQRAGMEVGTGVMEEYDRVHQRLRESMNRIASLESGTWRDGSALTAADRKQLRSQVMARDSMQAELARLKTIQSAVGWTPSELTQQVRTFLKEGKALPGE